MAVWFQTQQLATREKQFEQQQKYKDLINFGWRN